VFASAVTVIAAVPSKFTPLIARAVCSAVAVAALPVVEPEEPDTFPVTLPVRLPEKVPVTVPVKVGLAIGALAFSCVWIAEVTPLTYPSSVGVTAEETMFLLASAYTTVEAVRPEKLIVPELEIPVRPDIASTSLIITPLFCTLSPLGPFQRTIALSVLDPGPSTPPLAEVGGHLNSAMISTS
jgi:hypothetical protein